jgi:hypothetical protein
MELTDVLIHVSDKINDYEKGNLVKELRNLNGVIAPRFNQNKEHLLLVSYNSEAINSLTLLNEIKGKGYKAQLVGL